MTLEARSFKSSSRVRHGKYDPDTKVLELTFRRDGARVRYLNVPATVWAELLDAKSAGRYVDTLTRFRYQRL
jgi:hypothetical protein